jgi:hypothetical protein
MATGRGGRRGPRSFKQKAKAAEFKYTGGYKFTAARKDALKKAQEASAEARKLATGAVGGSQGISKVQVIANRFANRVTGSNTSALRKRQQAKAKLSTTANTAGSTARALTGTAASLYQGYKAKAKGKLIQAGVVQGTNSGSYGGRGSSMNSFTFNSQAALNAKTAAPATPSSRGSAVQSKNPAASSMRGGARSEAAWKAARIRTLKAQNPNLNANAIRSRVNLEWQRKKNKTGKRVTR